MTGWASRAGVALGVGAIGLLGGMAFANMRAALRAEERNPPPGRFVPVGELDVHVVDEGSGPPVLLIGGNGATVADWLLSGVPAGLVPAHRVVVVDRPGFGHTERPSGEPWGVFRQADLLCELVLRMGLDRPILVGHSLGATIGLAMEARHPGCSRGLVLVSGFYAPRVTAKLLAASAPAVPLVGPLCVGTLAPPALRRMAPLVIALLFAPRPVPPAFRAFPLELALRASQIQATADDAAELLEVPARLEPLLSGVHAPVALLAGDGDRIIDAAGHARWLADRLPQASLQVIPAAGHMLHHEEARQVLAAVGQVERATARTGNAAAAGTF